VEYLENKNPVCKPQQQWWIYVAFVVFIMKEVNIAFVAIQGLSALAGEQKKSLQRLKLTLIEISRASTIIDKTANENNCILGEHIVLNMMQFL
jgi:hypothetical protein